MSIQGIIDRFFNTTVDVQRRTISRTSTGDVSETWANIATGVKATIQALSITELNTLNQGKEFNATQKAYMPLDIVTIKNGDRLIDTETGRTHDVIGVQEHRAARVDIAIGHHYKIFLEIPRTEKT